MPKSEKMRQESREKILKTALGLFVVKGFHGTTTREITDAAGISKGLLYNYFPSKEAILGGIIDDRTQNLNAVIGYCKVLGNRDETISRFIQAYFALLRRDRDYLRFRTALVLQPGVPKEVTDLIGSRVGELFEAIVGMLAEVGVEDARDETYILMAKLEGIGLHYLGVLRDYPLDGMEEKIRLEYAKRFN